MLLYPAADVGRGAAGHIPSLPVSLLRLSSDFSRGALDLGFRITEDVTRRAAVAASAFAGALNAIPERVNDFETSGWGI